METTSPYRYSTAQWFEVFLGERLNRKAFTRIALLAATPWLIGFLIATAFGHAGRYVITPLYWIGSVGIFLTSATLVYGVNAQHRMYTRLAAAFDLTDHEKRSHLVGALDRHSNFFQQTRAAFLVFVGGTVIAVWGVFPDLSEEVSTLVGLSPPRFTVLKSYGWYDEARRATLAFILLGYLIPISAVLGTSTSVLIRMPIFLWRISSAPPRYPPTLLKTYYSPAATFYTNISLLWLVGVGLLFYLFWSNHNILSYIIVISAFSAGLVNLAVPQLAYLRSVSLSEDRYLDIISQNIPQPANCTDTTKRESESEFKQSVGVIVSLMKSDDWVYPVHQTYVVVGTYMFSLAGTLIGWDKLFRFVIEGA